MSGLVLNPARAGDAGIDWTARSAPVEDWDSIAYGNGKFVAVNQNPSGNSVMTSADGISWTPQSGLNSSWTDVTYGNGLFVAVAWFGPHSVMTSPDGINWNARTVPEDNQWSSVTFGDGKFVAVASTGTNRVMTSSDGITWTARAAALAAVWWSVTFGNSTFVAVEAGAARRVMTSSDGITWTERTVPENNLWRSVAFGNGIFVAVAQTGTNRVMTSSDGVTWTSRMAVDGEWVSVAFGDGRFVAVSFDGNNEVMISADGITWTSRTASDGKWTAVTYANGLFLAVGYSYGVSATPRVITSGSAALIDDGDYVCATGLKKTNQTTNLFTITSGDVGSHSSGKCTGAVVIPAGASSIFSPFQDATGLSSITIPATVNSISTDAFFGATSLTSIAVATDNQIFHSPATGPDAGVLFNKTSTRLVTFPKWEIGATYSIPATVTTIGAYAFASTAGLTSITIPSNVTSIENQAFHGANSLTSVYFLGDAPSVAVNSFSNIASGAKAYIKSGATGFGVAGANWNGLIVEVVVDTPAPAPAGNSAPAPAGNSVPAPAGNSVPTVETPAQVADTGLAARTIGFKKKYSAKTLAKQVGIKITSPKAKVSISAAKSSKKVCTKSGAKLRTLNAGNCVVTFTVQEPKPKKGNKPKATKTVMTLAVR